MSGLLYVLARHGQESAHQLDYHPESQIMVHMSPASYLRHCAATTTPAEWERFMERVDNSLGSSRMLALKGRLLAQEPLDALFLDADPFTGAVVSQEGQHRAFLAQSLGIALVPVLVFARIRHRFASEAEAPGWRSRLRALFDEAPLLSGQVSAALSAERAAYHPDAEPLDV
jgi:hypothetical protein